MADHRIYGTFSNLNCHSNRVFHDIVKLELIVGISDDKLVLLCSEPGAACQNVCSTSFILLLDIALVVCCLVQFGAVPEYYRVTGTNRKKQVLEWVVFERPDSFLFILVGVCPCADAVVLAI